MHDAVEARLGHDGLDRRRHSFRGRRALALLVIAEPKVLVESARLDPMDLTMRSASSLDRKCGVGLAMRVAEQFAPRDREPDKKGRLRAALGLLALRLGAALRPPLVRGADDHLDDGQGRGAI